MKRFGLILVCSALAFLVFAQPGFAQTEMTYEGYKLETAGLEKRIGDAKRVLAECQTAADELSKQIEGLDSEVATVQNEIYDLIGSNEAGVNEFLQELDRYEARLMSLLRLSDDALFEARDEFDTIVERVEEMGADNRALLPESKSKLASIDQLIEQVKARMPRKRIRHYSVLRGDSLWKIAKKDEIYKDPYLWPRIYVENKNLIKDPDLIYPNWVLNVPFGVDLNQHLVQRGDNLSLIAGRVYNDITKWNRIFQANNKQILNPNMIFPAQVFDVPAN
ncbi:MAG: LysM peptidoglycan-binding domain-containing protein [bacterium]|nr:LysM peptidoglycan-binding domain-containing protein [bacterium]